MKSIPSIVLASNNTKKLREFERLLSPLGCSVVAQNAFAVPEAPEPHCSFLENALEKARNASCHTGLPALADDSGICVHALNGNPGVNSAFYSGPQKNDSDNNARLIHDLQGITERSAHYTAVLAFVLRADDPEPIIAEGRWYGEIIDTPRGNGGFGYDPHFFDPELGLTGAEMSLDVKSSRSHRGKAVHQLLNALQARYSLVTIEPEKP